MKELNYLRSEIDNASYVSGKKIVVNNSKVHDLIDEVIQRRYVVVPDYVFRLYWRKDKKGRNFKNNPDYTIRLANGPYGARLGDNDEDVHRSINWVRHNVVEYVDATRNGCITKEMLD